MSLIVSSQVCRPTQSGEVIVLCSAKLDLRKHGESSSTSFEAVDPPLGGKFEKYGILAGYDHF